MKHDVNNISHGAHIRGATRASGLATPSTRSPRMTPVEPDEGMGKKGNDLLTNAYEEVESLDKSARFDPIRDETKTLSLLGSAAGVFAGGVKAVNESKYQTEGTSAPSLMASLTTMGVGGAVAGHNIGKVLQQHKSRNIMSDFSKMPHRTKEIEKHLNELKTNPSKQYTDHVNKIFQEGTLTDKVDAFNYLAEKGGLERAGKTPEEVLNHLHAPDKFKHLIEGVEAHRESTIGALEKEHKDISHFATIHDKLKEKGINVSELAGHMAHMGASPEEVQNSFKRVNKSHIDKALDDMYRNKHSVGFFGKGVHPDHQKIKDDVYQVLNDHKIV